MPVKASIALFIMFAILSYAFACPPGYYSDALTNVCFPYNPTTPLTDFGSDANRFMSNQTNAVSNGVNNVFHGKAPGPAKVDVPGAGRLCIPWC